MSNPTPETRTTAEQMAIAVLRGDYDAARMLATLLIDEYGDGARPVPVVLRLPARHANLRALVYARTDIGDVQFGDPEGFVTQIEEWLDGKRRVLPIMGIDRVELYEVPQPQAKESGT